MPIFLRILLTGIVVCTGATQAFCQQENQSDEKRMPTYGQWHSSRFGGGGYVQQVVISPSNPQRVYAYVDVGGVYRSDDAGRSWLMCHGNLPASRSNYSVRGLWVDPHDPDHVVIATGNRWDGRQGIYLSTDGGGSWTKTYDAWFFGNGYRRAAGNILVSDPGNANRLYLAAVDDGWAFSEDKGKTWQANGQLKGLNPIAIWVDQTNPKNIWVSCYEQKVRFQGEDRHFKRGLYLSQDRGQTFALVNDRDILEMVQLPWANHPLIAICELGHLGISQDMGKTFSALEDGLPIDEEVLRKNSSTSPSSFNALSMGPDFVLLGARNGDIYRLPENLSTWQHVKPTAIDEGDWWGRMKPGQWQHYGKALSAITISPNDPDHWYMTDWYAVYQSTNAGKTWELSIDGIEVTVMHWLLQDPFDPTLIHAGMADNGYIRSENRGVTFTKPDGGPSNVKHIAASVARKGLMFYVGPKDHSWLANQLYVSRNSGQSWSQCKMRGLPDMENQRCNSIALDPTNPQRLWLAVSGKIAPNEGGVYFSDDQGESFVWDSQGMAGNSFFTMSIWQAGPQLAINENGSMIAVSDSARLIYTRPAGESVWQNVNIKMTDDNKPSSVAAGVHAPGILAVAIRGLGLFLSSDNGKTFDHVWEGDACYVALDTQLPNRLAVSTSNGIVLSTDYGQTFQQLDRSLPDRVARLPMTFAGNRILVGTAGSGIFYIDLPKNQQPLTDAPWASRLNHDVLYLKTDQIQLGVLLYGGNLVDLHMSDEPNLMDTYSQTWVKHGKNMPSTAAGDRVEYRGHTIWLSPQSAWWQYQDIDIKLKEKKSSWPPDPYLTQLPYKVIEHTQNRLVLQSPPSPITGMQLTKTFHIDHANHVTVSTHAKNVSSQTMQWGLWSNTRVKAAGQAFIPITDQSDYVVEHVNPWKNPDTKYRFDVKAFDGWLTLSLHVSVPYDLKRDTKLRVNTAQRLIVYHMGDQVLLKRAEPIDVSMLPAEHRSVECYRSESQSLPTDELLEIQFHYPLKSLSPGQSLQASETWSLHHASEFGDPGNLTTWLNAVQNNTGASH